MTVPFHLAAGFPAPSESDWLRLAEKALKGAPVGSLDHTTADGVVLEPLYRDGDAVALSLPRAQGGPEQLTWDIRVAATHPDPAQANRLLLDDLNGGASSVLVSIDQGAGEGLAARRAGDLANALREVDLQLATVALDAGFLGAQAADWLAAVADNAPRARLAFHLDPLTAFAQAGASPGPINAHIEAAARTAAGYRETYREASLFLASGRAVHEAGGSAAQELAFAAAAAVTYAKGLNAAGLSIENAFARIVLGVSVDGEYFAGLAKVRAARLVWDTILSASGASVPARIEARSSRRMLSKMDPWVNLLRLTAAGFAAAVGGADAVLLEPFTQPLGLPGELARRQARNTQLILMEEAHVARVNDPGAGSWFIDAYTHDLAQAAWTLFQRIEAEGGAASAMISGRFAGEIAAVRDAQQAKIAAGEVAMVGVNLHPFKGEEALPVEPAPPRKGAAPDAALSGPDDHCPALAPIRWSQQFESAQ